MQITIIADDSSVAVDGRTFRIDLTALDPTIHAVQWNDVTQKGWIEYRPDDDGNRKLNDRITELAPFQQFVEVWNAAAATKKVSNLVPR